MTELISLKEVKAHCRIDDDYEDEDDLLRDYIAASLEVCQKHIGKRFGDDLAFNPALKVGCLMYICMLYENREMVAALTIKEVPLTISHLWSVYRDPGVY
ncbi:head-tail connector protein [Serratia oryzae]|uniref:Phage gp6-like head-tail connector protein n=1 Tax=Serratia oryzae TaxID=2034155 RepID=A0A1S8CMH9_9GAMM|nr:head-tail connector protein [Serratia oryzae]OMQ23709.1 hypothetical protein BMI79_09365 [Serratia oryzae]